MSEHEILDDNKTQVADSALVVDSNGVDGSSSNGVVAETSPESVVVGGLWKRRDLAEFLNLSPRWVDSALARAPGDHGSVPHVVLPSSGRRRQIRFIPEDVRSWVVMGFPPAEEFDRMRKEHN